MTKNATMELDVKALSRQMAKLKDECESYRSKWDTAQSKLHELSSECEGLRDQMKQKGSLVLNNHNSVTAKCDQLCIRTRLQSIFVCLTWLS